MPNGEFAKAKHALEKHHPIKWEDISVVDQARRPKELMLKEALHIQLTHFEEWLNQYVVIGLPDCYIITLKTLRCRVVAQGPASPDHMHR